MVKLIASDIDGTLIPYGRETLEPELFPLIHRLRAAGVLFSPASGRQYHSLRRLFAPVADEICFLCENGAILYGPGGEDTAPILSRTVMDRAEAGDLARAIWGLPGCELMVSGVGTIYVCTENEGFIHLIRDEKGNRVERVERLEELPGEILKVSAYCPGGTAAPAAALGPRWGGPFRMAAAGPDWLDFTLADKGTGLRGLCAGLGISLADVMAFGDNWNDEAMLEEVGTGYLMDTADPVLRAKFPRQCRSVLAVLEDLLKEMEA